MVNTKLRLRGLMADKYVIDVAKARSNGHAMVLKDVPCDMTFEVYNGVITYESAEHNYLPVFRLQGRITSITSNEFPFNVHTLTFGDSDSTDKEILYYPSPEELSHMIATGCYFTRFFELPSVLTKNTYTFPGKVNIIALPPEDLSMGDELNEMTVPIVYVEFGGTGVSRKNDKLLDYYGIQPNDLEPFVLTAQSSGYTDPPLMRYIEAPTVTLGDEKVLSDEYLTSQEEADLLFEEQVQPEVQEQEECMQKIESLKEMPVLSNEDILLARASQAIDHRIEIEMRNLKMIQKRIREEQSTVDEILEQENNRIRREFERQMFGEDYEGEKLESADNNSVQLHESDEYEFNDGADSQVSDAQVSDAQVHHLQFDDTLMADKSSEIAVEPILEDELGLDFEQGLNDSNLVSPDESEDYKAIEASFGDTLENDDDDIFVKDDNYILEDLNGADVDDLELQKKIDEKKSVKRAREVAVDKQQDFYSNFTSKIGANRMQQKDPVKSANELSL